MCVCIYVSMYVCITNMLIVTDKVDNKCIGADTDTERKECVWSGQVAYSTHLRYASDETTMIVVEVCIFLLIGKVLCDSGASDLMKELFYVFRVY